MGLISDEVFQKHFEVTPSSGVLTEESLCVVCKIRPPDDNWQPQTVTRVSINITYLLTYLLTYKERGVTVRAVGLDHSRQSVNFR